MKKLTREEWIYGLAGLAILVGVFLLTMQLVYGGIFACGGGRTHNCWPNPDPNPTVPQYLQ